MSDLHQVSKFVLGRPVRMDETRHIEFKEVLGKKPVDSIKNAADEYAVAFLNSEGGRIFWGVRDSDGMVIGVTLSAAERDLLRRDVTNKLGSIQPQIDPTQFGLVLHPVSTVDVIENLFVVELVIPRISVRDPFYTSSHEVFVRLDGVKKKLSGPQLTAWIKQRAITPKSVALDVSSPATAALVMRIQKIFSSHGLEVSHLPRFFAAMKAPFDFSLMDAQSPGAWLRWLDDKKMDWLANTFLIRREWIDGEDDRIFLDPHFDKNPKLFWNTVCEHVAPLTDTARIGWPEAYFIRRGKGKDWEKRGQSGVFMVLAVPIMQLSSERTIYKYISDFNEYPWDYMRAQIQLRAWVRLLYCGSKFMIHGREMSLDMSDKLASNQLFLRDLIEDRITVSSVNWHLDDYALSATESMVAKSLDTFPDVLKFLRDYGLPVDFPSSNK